MSNNQTCPGCGHEIRFSDNEAGVCEAVVGRREPAVFQGTDVSTGVLHCGHVCVFPEPAAESTELLPCPLSVSENLYGTWDIFVDGKLTHPRLTLWTQGSAEEAVRLIHDAYTRAAATAPAAEGDLISREDAIKATCFRCRNTVAYTPATLQQGEFDHEPAWRHTDGGGFIFACRASVIRSLPAAPAAAQEDAKIRVLLNNLSTGINCWCQPPKHGNSGSHVPRCIAVREFLSRLEQRRQ